MDDNLEKFIRKNREKFDNRDPGYRVWHKIEEHFRSGGRFRWHVILQRAAVVTIIFAASYGVNEFIHRFRNHELLTAKVSQSGKDSSIPGLQQTEAYYTGVIRQKMDELKPIMANCPTLKEELNVDMSELDSVYTDLRNDLKDNMANQEVIEAIIENYRLKIHILESLLSDIKPREDDCLSKSDGYEL